VGHNDGAGHGLGHEMVHQLSTAREIHHSLAKRGEQHGASFGW